MSKYPNLIELDYIIKVRVPKHEIEEAEEFKNCCINFIFFLIFKESFFEPTINKVLVLMCWLMIVTTSSTFMLSPNPK